ncbi:DUF6325 family protein [Conexibacter stalactiti]|uniref:DUF6325 family protein n=1 Tax=Conexibacter stalactiti TaxID=1940611 RepID=A0ABU4HXW5_9ACTN|nr:DUF6325 family protein [Conexibacter stalactiti]MDW5598065.1 DUF6325 family protein [Conexibacter stalactiti]MEC5038707.1 DUF6325 family protein [Conexibacter stalactiti]
MTLGPMQLVVFGFDGGEPRGEVLAELQRLAEHDIVRLVDVLAVRKAHDGTVQVLELSAIDDADGELGSVLATLTGLQAEADSGQPSHAEQIEAAEEDVWYVADAIPPGSAAAIALLEHRWAIPLRERLQGLGGRMLAESWVHPLDLEAIGLTS